MPRRKKKKKAEVMVIDFKVVTETTKNCRLALTRRVLRTLIEEYLAARPEIMGTIPFLPVSITAFGYDLEGGEAELHDVGEIWFNWKQVITDEDDEDDEDDE